MAKKTRRAGWRFLKAKMQSCTEPEVLDTIWYGLKAMMDCHMEDLYTIYSDRDKMVTLAFEQQIKIG